VVDALPAKKSARSPQRRGAATKEESRRHPETQSASSTLVIVAAVVVGFLFLATIGVGAVLLTRQPGNAVASAEAAEPAPANLPEPALPKPADVKPPAPQPPPEPVVQPPPKPERPVARDNPPPAVIAGGDAKLTAETLAALKNATVFVKVDAGRLSATGSGFLMKVEGQTGYIVTNHHVITPPIRVPVRPRVSVVFWSGRKEERVVPAEVVASDDDRDLAVLKVVNFADLPEPLNLEQKAALVETMTVWMLGFPFGEALSTSRGNPAITIGKGTVSSIRQNDRDETAIVQIDGELNPGNSGGPVVDNEGRLVGVTVAKISGTRIGLAIPPEELTKMLHGRVGGVSIQTRSVNSGMAEIEATVLLIDPLNKLQRVGIRYLAAGAGSQKPSRDKDGRWLPMPGGQEVDMAINQQKASGTFQVAAPNMGLTTYTFQTVYTNGAGQTTYTGPSTFRVNSSQSAVAMRPPQSSGNDPVAKPSNADLSGTRTTVGGISTSEVQLPAGNAEPCMCWTADGKGFYFLERNGILRRINLAGFKEERKLDLGRKASWLSPSAQGLLVALPDQQEAWLLDTATFKVKQKMPAPSVTRALSAPSLSIGFAFAAQGDLVNVLNLKTGQILRQHNAREFGPLVSLRTPVITPDGKYIFTSGMFEQVNRLRVTGDDLQFEESSPRILQGRFVGLCVSGDSAYVCGPSGGGNYGAPGHPQIAGYSTYIYPVTSLNTPVCTLEQGAYPLAVGFDPKAGLIYTQNHQFELIVFTDKGIKLKEYSLRCGEPKQYLVHPAGRKLLLLTANKLLQVELEAQ
jgi:S1-C subfamily serine protease